MSQFAYQVTPAESGLFTDLYELTMAQTYFNEGKLAPATFSLFFRAYPPNRGFLVCAGLEETLQYLEEFRFGAASLSYLKQTAMFSVPFLEYLSKVRFTGSVRALAEGRIFFANAPALEVTAPLVEAQLVETLIINRLNWQSLQATKAVRCVNAARGRVVSDFGARRSPGVDGALTMARAGYLAGFQSTSNALGAQRYGIPPAGTMAHSLITAYPSEIDAFRAYARAFPQRTILLLDTYDTVKGARNAATVGREMEDRGQRLVGVRLDSGDYAALSRQVRRILDEAGLDYVQIVASGGLDEYEIDRLAQDDAPIDIFGVGTRVSVSADAPYTDMSYKLTCYNRQPAMKLSPDKVSPPGAKQVFRWPGPDGKYARDVVALADESLPGGEPLLQTVMRQGKRTRPAPAIEELRQNLQQDLNCLAARFQHIYDPPRYPVAFSLNLIKLTEQVRGRLTANLAKPSDGGI